IGRCAQQEGAELSPTPAACRWRPTTTITMVTNPLVTRGDTHLTPRPTYRTAHTPQVT
ncbi:hypothetical protein GOODEAATRI_034289, partial [Goodea atripinnis]